MQKTNDLGLRPAPLRKMSRVKGVYKGKREEPAKDTRKTPATRITEAKGSISKST